MATTPFGRTRAVVETREFLGILATADEVEIPGLVQSLARCLLRDFPLDGDIALSATLLPEIWADPHEKRRHSAVSTLRTDRA
jgi:hypothetical protein